MPEEKLRFGILSTGNIAGQFTRDLARSRRCVAVAVGSRSAASARAFAAEHGIDTARAYGDNAGDDGSRAHDTSVAGYEALLADDGVDAIYIGLPNSLHHDWTLKALAAGKHVLCEKPIAANAEQARAMFDAAEKHGRVLVEAFMYRSTPLMAAVADVVRSGLIGDVRLVRASFCYAMHRWQGNIRFNRDLAGGALMDIGCYCINFARFIARVVNSNADVDPGDVHATAHLHESGIDNLTVGTLGFDLTSPLDHGHASGATSGITSGATSGVRLVSDFVCGMSTQSNNMAIVSGSHGYIEIPVPWKPPMNGCRYTVDFQTPPRLAGGGPKPGRKEHTLDFDRPVFAYEADDFAATVLDGAAPAITPADSIGNMRVLDAMRRQVGVA